MTAPDAAAGGMTGGDGTIGGGTVSPDVESKAGSKTGSKTGGTADTGPPETPQKRRRSSSCPLVMVASTSRINT